jgi:hypothetical protein
VCEPFFTYVLKLDASGTALAISSSPTNWVYKPVQGGTNLDFETLSSDNNNEGTLVLRIDCTNSDSGVTQSKTFDLVVTPDCSAETITTAAISGVSYTVLAATSSTTFTAWTTSRVSCPLSYSLTQDAVTVAPGTISLSANEVFFAPVSRTLKVYQIDNEFQGQSFNMVLTGTNTAKSETVSFTLTIVRDCSSATVTPPGNFARQYNINSGDKNYNVKTFGSSDSYCKPFW